MDPTSTLIAQLVTFRGHLPLELALTRPQGEEPDPLLPGREGAVGDEGVGVVQLDRGDLMSLVAGSGGAEEDLELVDRVEVGGRRAIRPVVDEERLRTELPRRLLAEVVVLTLHRASAS